MNSLRTEKLRAFIKSPDTAVLIKMKSMSDISAAFITARVYFY